MSARPALRIVRELEPNVSVAVDELRAPDVASEPSALMDLTELCHHTLAGLRTVRRWIAAGKVPGLVRLPGGRAIRFRRDVIEEWIRAGCPEEFDKN